MPLSDREPELVTRDAIDVIALGYPLYGTADEKAGWMADLQAMLEVRAPDALDAAHAAKMAGTPYPD